MKFGLPAVRWAITFPHASTMLGNTNYRYLNEPSQLQKFSPQIRYKVLIIPSLTRFNA